MQDYANACSAFNPCTTCRAVLAKCCRRKSFQKLKFLQFYESQCLGFLFSICIRSQAET